MTLDPDHGFGLLSPEVQERMELILTERSDGSYGAPALHGMLTASVVGPKPVPMDWILQTVLSPPESEAIGFDDFPEFTWVVEKIEEWLLRIGRVFQQDPEMFRLLVYMPKLKEGDTTPDPQTWCNGFVEGMACNRENWAPILATKFGFERIASILMTSDPDEWKKGCFEPVYGVDPVGAVGRAQNRSSGNPRVLVQLPQLQVPSERRILPAEMIRVPAAAAKKTLLL
jgi:yecA family protein